MKCLTFELNSKRIQKMKYYLFLSRIDCRQLSCLLSSFRFRWCKPAPFASGFLCLFPTAFWIISTFIPRIWSFSRFQYILPWCWKLYSNKCIIFYCYWRQKLWFGVVADVMVGGLYFPPLGLHCVHFWNRFLIYNVKALSHYCVWEKVREAYEN
jgi:hypothetical protein